jgi:hypothetical protein
MFEVSGTIIAELGSGEKGPAIVYVRLLNTGRADAAALRVAEVRLSVASLAQLAAPGLPFVITAAEIDPRGRYEIDVWIDLDGDGEISAGDYLTTTAYPALTRGQAAHVVAYVRRVGAG